MDSITGITQMGMQLVAGDSRLCAGTGTETSAHGAWQAFASAHATKPATTRTLIDVPDMYGNRRPRSSQ